MTGAGMSGCTVSRGSHPGGPKTKPNRSRHRRAAPDVAGDRDVFVGLQLPDVVGVHLLGQAVVRPERLGLEAAEQPVPDDQDAAVVPVEVLLVHAVVHPVVRRRVEDEFDWPPELADALGVNPELVDQVDGEAGEHHPRRHAEQRQQRTQEYVAADVPLLPKRGGEVEVLAGVVRLMRRPEAGAPGGPSGGRRNRAGPRREWRSPTCTRRWRAAATARRRRTAPRSRTARCRSAPRWCRSTRRPSRCSPTRPASGRPRTGARWASVWASLRAAAHSMISSRRKNGTANVTGSCISGGSTSRIDRSTPHVDTSRAA